MKRNKLILDYCPNYYKIKNYDFDETDYITLNLLEYMKNIYLI